MKAIYMGSQELAVGGKPIVEAVNHLRKEGAAQLYFEEVRHDNGKVSDLEASVEQKTLAILREFSISGEDFRAETKKINDDCFPAVIVTVKRIEE